eukprot:TRINITY_DN1086_c1_g1_i1.p1 TRINITY_DN1086_c1_g1~~TRINITY_DN1086_c1_g1_i1.p1  ORF type:complete len:309 (-),score=125.69 TRINITY_DN1086_c1_g1_i1:33-893(-)
MDVEGWLFGSTVSVSEMKTGKPGTEDTQRKLRELMMKREESLKNLEDKLKTSFQKEDKRTTSFSLGLKKWKAERETSFLAAMTSRKDSARGGNTTSRREKRKFSEDVYKDKEKEKGEKGEKGEKADKGEKGRSNRLELTKSGSGSEVEKEKGEKGDKGEKGEKERSRLELTKSGSDGGLGSHYTKESKSEIVSARGFSQEELPMVTDDSKEEDEFLGLLVGTSSEKKLVQFFGRASSSVRRATKREAAITILKQDMVFSPVEGNSPRSEESSPRDGDSSVTDANYV